MSYDQFIKKMNVNKERKERGRLKWGKKETISKYLKKIAALTCVLILGAVSLTACGRSNDSKSSDLSGEVVIAGSTSVQPLSEELAKEFMKEHGDVKVTVQGGGSGQGIKSIEEKIADIGSLSRDVKDEEKKSVNKEYTIAKDGVPAVVCTDVDIDDISLKQLKDIYTGKITNWKDVGGKDKKISVISRKEGSGTRGAFTELTGVLVKDDKGNETDNAIKYSHEGGRIWISCRKEEDKTVLMVKDEGIGINPGDIPRLFERFYRADQSRTRKVSRTGLGLSIVKHITALFDARIEVKSKPGTGSLFKVIF